MRTEKEGTDMESTKNPVKRAQECPPHNIDAERSVLSACLLSREAVEEMAEELEAEDFFRVSHQLIFRAARCLVKRGKPVDYITVKELLEKERVLEEAGGAAALITLMDNSFSLLNYSYHAEILKRTAMQRRLIVAATEIIAMANDPQDDIAEVREQALELIAKAVSDGQS